MKARLNIFTNTLFCTLSKNVRFFIFSLVRKTILFFKDVKVRLVSFIVISGTAGLFLHVRFFILRIYVSYVLYIRSFFLTEQAYYISLYYVYPSITAFFLFCRIYFCADSFSAFSNFYLVISLALSMLIYDSLGSFFAFKYFHEPESLIGMVVTLIVSDKNSSSTLRRHVSTRSIMALVVGNTPMTATGRAWLAAGTITGIAWYSNAYLDRQAANARSDADRAHSAAQAASAQAHAATHAATQSAINRAFSIYQEEKKNWDNSWFKSTPAPKWEEPSTKPPTKP